jgi:hypothetical protein
MPPAATRHAMIAPNGPVATAQVFAGKMPAQIIARMTSVHSENRDNLFCDEAAMMEALPKAYFSCGFAPLF